MAYVNTKKMLAHARLNNYAIGAYNVFNLESIKAIIKACAELNHPVIIQASESAVNYAGAKNIADIVKNESKNYTIPVALHLDHGKSYEKIVECIDAGFSSVMIDASKLSYADNVKLTKKVVSYAHRHKVTVEAELGEIIGVEDNTSNNSSHLTNPTEALKFIKETNVDSLAVSIGTAHGINKGTKKPEISYEILNELEKLLPKDFPLVCHGASSVDNSLVSNYLSSGGKLSSPQGISHADLKRMSTTTPISKINVDTDLKLTFVASLRHSLNTAPEDFDPRSHLKIVKDALINRVKFMNTELFR